MINLVRIILIKNLILYLITGPNNMNNAFLNAGMNIKIDNFHKKNNCNCS